VLSSFRTVPWAQSRPGHRRCCQSEGRRIVELAALGAALGDPIAGRLLGIHVPIPTPEEQGKISRLITAAQVSQGRSVQHLKMARRAVARFRQAILAAACSGRLTVEWRDHHLDVEPADKTLERHRDERREQLGHRYKEPRLPDTAELPEIPESWAWAALPELGELGRGKSKHRPRNDPRLYGGPYPFIQTGDVARSGGKITAHSQTYNEAGLAQSKLWPERTVCITIAANIADSGLLTYPACFPDSVVGLIADDSIAVPEYVELFIRTVRRNLAAFAPATAQANINLAILAEVAVALPPVEEQREIVARAEAMYEVCAKVETAIQGATRRVERSSQAILARAFQGGLIGAES
jgi:type I restriction enzyme, S subunit